MLINNKDQYLKTSFVNEAELESIVEKYSEHLFGSGTIFLPKTKIKTDGGKGTIPDAFVIDVQQEEWYLVEVELAHHGTWNHIAPQVSKQLVATESQIAKDKILDLALSHLKSNKPLIEMLNEFGIGKMEIHGKLQNILRKPPTIAIPIDSIPTDLKNWISTLKHKSKVWLIEKFVSLSNENDIFYSFPDETSPSISTQTEKGKSLLSVKTRGSQPFQELLDTKLLSVEQVLHFNYGPKGKRKKQFEGIVKEKGIEVDGKVFSPSYAAVYCIQKTGSLRKTANGWTIWRTHENKLLDDLYNSIPSNGDNNDANEKI